MREGWVETTLGELAVLAIGKTPPRKDPEYWSESLERPFCTIADMGDWWVAPGREGVSELAEAEGKAKRVPAGSLIMSFKLTIGRIGFAETDIFPNEAIVWIQPGPEALPEYLALWLDYSDLEEFAGRAVKGKTLNGPSLRAIPVVLPPLAEQRRIVDLIGAVDELLAAARRDNQARSSAMGALLESMVSRAEGDTMTTLGEVAAASWGNTSVTKSAYRDEGFVAYSATGPDGFVDWFEHDETGIVLSAIGARCGKTWLAEGKWTPIKNTIWFRACVEDVRTEYLYLLTSNPTVWPIRGQAQPFIGLGDVRKLTISYPSLAQQDDAIRLFKDFRSSVDASEAFLTSVVAARSAMLHDLLSGTHEIPASFDSLLEMAS